MKFVAIIGRLQSLELAVVVDSARNLCHDGCEGFIHNRKGGKPRQLAEGVSLSKISTAPRDRTEPEPSHAADPKPAVRVQTQFSRGFGDWLIRERVGLVCSTYQTGHLIFIGVRADGRPVPSAAGFSRAMGLATFSQRIYVATKNEIWRLENILAADELANDIFDRFYAPRNAQVTGDLDIHELAIDPSGQIFFANTRFSCLATVSQTHAFKPVWKPSFISKLAPEDRCHLNGLAMENNRARYVTACSTGNVVDSWRGARRDGGVVIDVETDAIVADGLSMPHSPRAFEGGLYVLDSGRGYLVRIDRQSGKRDDIAFCPGYARGLAFVSHYAVVTISLPRPGAFERLAVWETIKANGAAPWCGLLGINLHNGDVEQWLRLEGDVTELFDVGIIPSIRCPRGIGPHSVAFEESTRGEGMQQ